MIFSHKRCTTSVFLLYICKGIVEKSVSTNVKVGAYQIRNGQHQLANWSVPNRNLFINPLKMTLWQS